MGKPFVRDRHWMTSDDYLIVSDRLRWPMGHQSLHFLAGAILHWHWPTPTPYRDKQSLTVIVEMNHLWRNSLKMTIIEHAGIVDDHALIAFRDYVALDLASSSTTIEVNSRARTPQLFGWMKRVRCCTKLGNRLTSNFRTGGYKS